MGGACWREEGAASRLAGGQGHMEVSVSPWAGLPGTPYLGEPVLGAGSNPTKGQFTFWKHLPCVKPGRTLRGGREKPETVDPSRPPTQQGFITRQVLENPRNPHGHHAQQREAQHEFRNQQDPCSSSAVFRPGGPC